MRSCHHCDVGKAQNWKSGSQAALREAEHLESAVGTKPPRPVRSRNPWPPPWPLCHPLDMSSAEVRNAAWKHKLCMLWRFVKMSLFWLINANFMRAAPCLVFQIVTYLNSLKPYMFSSMSETAKTCRKYIEILVISSACLFGVGAATSRGTGRTFQQLFFSIFSFFSFFCCRACPSVCCHSCLCQTNKINWSSLAATGSWVSQSWLVHILSNFC